MMIPFLLAQTPEETPSPSPTPSEPPEPLFIVPSLEQMNSFISTLVISLVIASLLYIILIYGLRIIFRRLDKEIALVTINVSQTPLLFIFILVSLKIPFHKLTPSLITDAIEKVLTAGLVITVSYWIAQIFTQVIAYYLKKYAEKSEAAWDDVLIPILETTVPVLVYLFGGFIFLQTLGLDLTGIWVALGGATFILGFALQDILSNFFSGLVLLIDTPFQFGDVISLEDGSIAIIRKIGIRVTNLLLIDTSCEMFMPNATLQGGNIINLSRPAPHYYYSINLPLRADTDPSKAMKIIKEVVLAHPDTLGKIDEKLNVLDNYYKFTDDSEFSQQKRAKKEVGRERLIAENNVNHKILEFHEAMTEMIDRIQVLEKGGLESDEARRIQGYYLEIVKIAGLQVIKERQGKRRISWLEEAKNLDETVIGLVRNWYISWSKDPDLTEEDPYYLREEWERKIQLFKLRMNKLYQKIFYPSVDETRLDDYTHELVKWMGEKFKNTNTLWQAPKSWTDTIQAEDTVASMEYIVKFYIDNIKLEQCQRGNRIKSEVQGELIRQLRQVYIYR